MLFRMCVISGVIGWIVCCVTYVISLRYWFFKLVCGGVGVARIVGRCLCRLWLVLDRGRCRGFRVRLGLRFGCGRGWVCGLWLGV